MDTSLRHRGSESLVESMKDQQRKSTKVKDALNACMEQHEAWNSPDLDAEENSEVEAIDTLESSLTKLLADEGKDADADEAKQQIDALAHIIANISIKVAKLEHAQALLDRAAALQDAMATQMAVENILREVASLMSEAKNPQMQLKTPMDSSDQLNSTIRCQISKVVSLNKAADNLRTVRAALLNRREQSSLEFAPLRQGVDTAVAEIEASISKAFNRALVKVEASILNFQNRLKELSLDVERLHDFLPSVQKVLSALDDKGTYFESIVGFIRVVSDGVEMAHTTKETLAHLEMEKYVVAIGEVEKVRNALDNLDLALQGDDADRED